MSTIIEVNNHHHLGDNIINFIFFYKIKDYIEANNIIIHYYCWEKYHKNLKDFICSNNIKLFPCEDNIIHGYVLWQATTTYEHFIEDTLCKMFNIFLNTYNIPITVNSFEYEDPDLFKRFEELEDKYKKIDILIINSTPLSCQYNDYGIESVRMDWDNFIIKLSEKYNVATTEKVNDILCLETFSVKNIAAIALYVKKIIAINTGPSIPLYNTNILDNIEDLYLFGGGGQHYNFKTRKVTCLSKIEELNFLLE
jgi:hypothetical protein